MDFRSLPGTISYSVAREIQLGLVEQRAQDEIPDTVLFLEHEQVITRGRGLQLRDGGGREAKDEGGAAARHMPAPARLPEGIAFAETERGGDLTYHGPGQLVVYPIFKLRGHDLSAFLRGMESAVGEVVAGLCGGSVEWLAREGASGVWVRRPGEPEARARKVASMGVAVRRWVTYHGLALNCVNSLEPFGLISPCGYSPEVMTRLADLVPEGSETARELADWNGRGRRLVERRLAERLLGP